MSDKELAGAEARLATVTWDWIKENAAEPVGPSATVGTGWKKPIRAAQTKGYAIAGERVAFDPGDKKHTVR